MAGVCGVAAGLLVACGDDEDGSTSVTLESPAPGTTIAGGVDVEMAAAGLTIEPAGEVRDGAGHFHVVADDGCVAKGETVPKDADHVHFGKGQSSGTVYLGPGDHELCLLVADGAHTALGPTDRAKVHVGIASQDDWCKVIAETDVLFESVDESNDDFAGKQTGYENISRLVAQLEDGLDAIDPSARVDVQAALDFAGRITGVFRDAEDMDDATARAEDVFGNRDPNALRAAPWIKDTCGVDIDG